MDSLRQALNASLFLGLEDFECHFALYPPGAYYQKHVDRFRDDDARTVSAVLYLNDAWLPEHGGALRLHLPQRQVDIQPTGGSLVVFMSAGTEHEVLPASRDRLSHRLVPPAQRIPPATLLNPRRGRRPSDEIVPRRSVMSRSSMRPIELSPMYRSLATRRRMRCAGRLAINWSLMVARSGRLIASCCPPPLPVVTSSARVGCSTPKIGRLRPSWAAPRGCCRRARPGSRRPSRSRCRSPGCAARLPPSSTQATLAAPA